jgi:hypothetical protein
LARLQPQAFSTALAEALRLIRTDASVYEEVSREEFAQVPPDAVEAGTARLLGTAGIA